MELPNGMKELSKDNQEVWEVWHDYFKLAARRVMQYIRLKYSVPPEDMLTLNLAIYARFLNEGCYALGSYIKNGTKLDEIFDKNNRLNLLKIMNDEPLDPMDRTDIDTDIQHSVDKFRQVILKNTKGFYR